MIRSTGSWLVFGALGFVVGVSYAVELRLNVEGGVRNGEKLFVLASVVNLREEPKTSAKSIAKLPIATQVNVDGPRSWGFDQQEKKAMTWFEVTVESGEHTGQSGWLAADYLSRTRPTLDALFSAFDRTPIQDTERRRKWAERAVALDPSSGEAIRRLKNSPKSLVPELKDAIDSRQISRVKELLRSGIDINVDLTPYGSEGTGGITPLLAALGNGDSDLDTHLLVTYLVENGANVNARGHSGMGEVQFTPLSLAVGRGQTDIVALLLRKGANPNHCVIGANGTPLVLAVRKGNIELIKLLVASGADINAKGCQYGGFGVTALCAATGNPETLGLLLSLGGNPNARNEDGSTPLMCAVQNGNTDAAQVLVKAGANPNATDLNGTNALLRVHWLDQNKVQAEQPSARFANSLSDVFAAYRARQAELAKVLLRAGADPDLRNKKGDSFSAMLGQEKSQDLKVLLYPAATSRYSISKPEVFRFKPRAWGAYGADVRDNYLYVAESGNGEHFLEIFDLSGLRNMTSLSATPLSQEGLNVSVRKDIAYVAADQHGLQIFDISNPRNPTLIGTLALRDFTTFVKTESNRAYVLSSYSGRDWGRVTITIVDVSNPKNPKILGQFRSTADGARRFQVYKNHIFLAHKRGGLYVIDVSQPESPALKSKYAFDSPVTDVFVTDDVAYVALAQDRKFRIVDVSDLSKPTLVEGIDFTQQYIPFRHLVFVKDYQLLVDMRDESSPRLVAVLSHLSGRNYVVYDNLVVKVFENEILRFPRPFLQRSSDIVPASNHELSGNRIR